MKNKEINLSSSTLDNSMIEPEDEGFEEKLKRKKAEEEKGKEKSEKKGLKKKIDNFKIWWGKAPIYKKILVTGVPAILMLGGSIFFVYQIIYGPKTTTPKLINIDTEYLAPKTKKSGMEFSQILLKEPSIPRTEESPINGRLFTKEEMEELKERRPVAVMINNNPDARPTSNLSQADLMFETLVEGGATRILAIYWSREPNKVGTIRSARQYYLEWLSPFDPLFIYDGFASSDDPKTDAGGNISRYSIKSVNTVGAWRVNDRLAPHNEYSSPISAWEYAEKQGWGGFPTIEPWKFKKDEKNDNRGDRFEASVNFADNNLYNISWEYDKNSNQYLRKIAGQNDIDLETGQQLSAKNVVIQEVKIEGPVDEYARLIIETIDSGNARILMDGKVINGTWEKKNRTSRTKYFDSSGEEIHFNRGLTWIVAISQLDTRVNIT